MQIPIIGGAYQARAPIASAQRCINLYPEINPKDSPTPVTQYQRAGLTPKSDAPAPAIGRGCWRDSQGNGWTVIGNGFYSINSDWSLTLVGTLPGNRTNPCSLTDNGIVAWLVDGSANGWSITLKDYSFSTIGDSYTNNILDTIGSLGNASTGYTVTAPGNAGLIPAGATVSSFNAPTIGNNVTSINISAPTTNTITNVELVFSAPKFFFSQLPADPTGAFVGGTRVDYLDTFMICNQPGTNLFTCTLSNQLQFNSLYFAGKTDYPDPLETLMVNRHELLLVGALKTEAWYDAGNAGFPFAELPGAYFEHGTGAPYSIASADISTFFLGQDLQGQGYVFRIRGYECTRVSNHALEYQIRKMTQTGIITDAVGYTHQQDGHLFYVLTFPTGDQTWVFDDSTEQWIQRAWTDLAGGIHRDRGMAGAFVNGVNICQDWQNGTIYQIDPSSYTDVVAGVSYPIQFIRGFPHIMNGEASFGSPGFDREVPSNGKTLSYDNFIINIQGGNAPAGSSFNLNISTDRGNTWLVEPLQSSAGNPGQYNTRPQFRALGLAQDMVFELSWNFPGEAPLNGAWLKARVNEV